MTSRAEKERTARNLIRQAFANGWATDALAIDYAVAAMGQDARPLVVRVYEKEFKIMGAN
jgi:hypothetical protein